jgi:hypothetical protein
MRLIVLLLASSIVVRAAVLEASYDISYWFLGRIGTTTLRCETGKGRYRIEAEARLDGIAAVLAHHHTERHISTGRIGPDRQLIPERYDVITTRDGYRKEKHYVFDRRHHRILLRQRVEHMVNKRHFDALQMRHVSAKKPETLTSRSIEPYRAQDDLLTLYFNAGKVLRQLPPQTGHILYAAGAEEGRVKIIRNNESFTFSVFLNQEIFRSHKGELQIETDRNLYVKRAVLKDVFLFGDLKVERAWLRQSP